MALGESIIVGLYGVIQSICRLATAKPALGWTFVAPSDPLRGHGSGLLNILIIRYVDISQQKKSFNSEKLQSCIAETMRRILCRD